MFDSDENAMRSAVWRSAVRNHEDQQAMRIKEKGTARMGSPPIWSLRAMSRARRLMRCHAGCPGLVTGGDRN